MAPVGTGFDSRPDPWQPSTVDGWEGSTMSIEEGLPADPMDEPVADRVARGVRLLDEMAPAGWRERVDVERVSQASGIDCVAAQAFGTSWSYAAARLGITSPAQAARYGFAAVVREGNGVYDYACTCGYCPDTDADEDAYPALNDEWRRVLTAGLIP